MFKGFQFWSIFPITLIAPLCKHKIVCFSKSAHSCFLPYVSRIRRIFLFLILKNDGWFKTIVCNSTNSTSTTQFVKNYKHLPILTAWYLVLNKTFSRNMSKPNSFTKLLYNLLNLLNDKTNSV